MAYTLKPAGWRDRAAMKRLAKKQRLLDATGEIVGLDPIPIRQGYSAETNSVLVKKGKKWVALREDCVECTSWRDDFDNNDLGWTLTTQYVHIASGHLYCTAYGDADLTGIKSVPTCAGWTITVEGTLNGGPFGGYAQIQFIYGEGGGMFTTGTVQTTSPVNQAAKLKVVYDPATTSATWEWFLGGVSYSTGTHDLSGVDVIDSYWFRFWRWANWGIKTQVDYIEVSCT